MKLTVLLDPCWARVEHEIRAVINVAVINVAVINVADRAEASGAFRQAPGVPSAAARRRLAMISGVCGLSLRQTCAWAARAGLAELSNPARRDRLTAAAWLGQSAGALRAARAALSQRWAGWRIRRIDATMLSAPGADGAPGAAAPGRRPGDRAEHGRGPDRGSGRRTAGAVRGGTRADRRRRGRLSPSARAAPAAGGAFIVRLGWHSWRLRAPGSTAAFDLFGYLRHVRGATAEWPVQVDDHGSDQPPLGLRLVALRQSPEAAEQARRRAQATAKRHGKAVEARPLDAAEWIPVLTSLPSERFPAEAIPALDRRRWPVERVIQRWKSLLGLGELPNKNPELARCWMNAKLIAAILIENTVSAQRGLFPPQPCDRTQRPFSVAAVRVGQLDCVLSHSG